jgi:hypothetical protein
MQTLSKRRKRHAARARLIAPLLFSLLLLLLILSTVFLVLGNLKLIYWPDNLNTVFISIILPDLGIVIALAQWLHTLSAEKKEEQGHFQEHKIKPLASVSPVIPQNPPITSETPIAEQGKNVTMSMALHDEEEQMDMGEAPRVEHFYGRVDELATIRHWMVDEQSHLISIIGVGGIGKTRLCACGR